MELNEEEKKAVETTKKEYELSKNNDMSAVLDYEDLGILLNLIEKLQKENEEQKERIYKLSSNHFAYERMTGIDLLLPDKPNVISKDKIREKIEELDNEFYEKNAHEEDFNFYYGEVYGFATENLRELLEEE